MEYWEGILPWDGGEALSQVAALQSLKVSKARLEGLEQPGHRDSSVPGAALGRGAKHWCIPCLCRRAGVRCLE